MTQASQTQYVIPGKVINLLHSTYMGPHKLNYLKYDNPEWIGLAAWNTGHIKRVLFVLK